MRPAKRTRTVTDILRDCGIDHAAEARAARQAAYVPHRPTQSGGEAGHLARLKAEHRKRTGRPARPNA